MGIGTIALNYAKTGLKYASVLPKYAFGDGYSVISKARKSVGGGYTVFQNSKAKTKAGWQALKQNVAATANKPSTIAATWKKGVISEAKTVLRNGGKVSLLTKLKGGLKGLYKASKNSLVNNWGCGVNNANFAAMAKQAAKGLPIKGASTLGKIWGGTKGLLSPLKKIPLFGTVIALGLEAPEIYNAFSKGGFVEGMKQVGVSGVKITAGTILGALGTTVGGPIGGMIGYAAGDMLAGLVFKSYSEKNPAETEQNEAANENAGVMPPEADNTAARQEAEAQLQQADQAQQSEQSEQSEQTQQSQDDTTAQQTTATQGQNDELPATLQASDTSVQPQLTSNPYMQQTAQYTNPFGFDANTNIFQRFPMGYTFQYQGNGMGMMV